jgi:hypothetical protein
LINYQTQHQKTWITGETVFQTEISILQNSDLKSVTKKMVGFNWSEEFKIQLEIFINLQLLEILKLFKDLLA